MKKTGQPDRKNINRWGAYAPTRKVIIMKLNELFKVTKNMEKIKITKPKSAVADICNALLKLKILLFSNLIPLMNMGSYKMRITEDIAVSLIRSLLTDSDSLELSDNTLKDVIERLSYLPQLQVDLDKGFRDGQLYVNVGNGVYSIMERQLVELEANIDFDYTSKIDYKPGAKLDDAPHFKRFVEMSVGKENYNCLMRVLGYCISSLTKGRKAFVFLGKGKTGKSTLLNVLQSIFDPDLVSHQPFHVMGSEKSRWHYAGKRINISRDNSSTPMRDEEGFKSLVSCEETVGREVYKEYINYTPTAKFIFASNWPLCFAHPDDAVIDRLVVIRFTREIPKDQLDPELEEKLKSEADVIFSLALDTLKDLVDSNYDFCMSKDSEEYLHQQRVQIHSALNYLEEETVLNANGSVSSEMLFAGYNEYCRLNAITPLGRNTFLQQVKDYSRDISYTKVYWNGKRVNGFKGIRFASSNDQEEQNDK